MRYWRNFLMMGILTIGIIALAVMPVRAQEDENEFIEFVSEDETVQITYPEGWQLLEELLPANVVMLTNDEAFFENTEMLNPEDGNVVLTILILTDELLSILNIEFPADLADEDLTAFALENMIDPYYGLNGEQLAEDEVEIGEIEHVVINEDFEVDSITIKQPTASSVNFAYRMDDLIMVVSASVFGDELDTLEDTIFDIVASFEYNAPEDETDTE